MSRPRRYARAGLGLVLSAGFLYLALRRVPFEDALERIGSASFALLSLSVLLKCCSLCLMGVRAAQITGQRTMRTTFDHFGLVLVAQAGNAVLPFRLGELLRVKAQTEVLRQPLGAVVACIFLERFADLTAIALLAGIAVLLGASELAGVWTFALVLGAAAVFLVLLKVWASRRKESPEGEAAPVGRLGRLVEQAKEAAEVTRVFGSRRRMLAITGLTVAQWSLSLVSIWLWILAFGETPTLLAATAFIGMVSLAMILPSAPSGVGAYEYFGARALVFAGLGGTAAFAITLTGHLLAIAPVLLFGLPFLVTVALGGWPGGLGERENER